MERVVAKLNEPAKLKHWDNYTMYREGWHDAMDAIRAAIEGRE